MCNQNLVPVNEPIFNTSRHSKFPTLNPCDYEGFDYIISTYIIGGHMYVLGATRSGKTEFIKLVCIRLILKQDGSIVVFDPHGDLALQLAKLMDNKKDIIFIDPTLKDGFTPTINPMRLKKKMRNETTIAIVAQELISAIESIIGEDFSPAMEALLTPLIYVLLRKGDSGIDEILRFLDDENNEDLIKLSLQSPIQAHVDFMRTQFSKAKFKRTKDALSTKLQLLLNNPLFSNFITGDSTFDLEKALNNKKIIIFRLPKGKMRKTLEPAAKLIMALIQGIVFRRSDIPDKKLRPKTYLICDEYQNFFSEMSDEILSESAKNNLFILGAHQYLSQLTGKSRDGLMSGAGVKVVGRNSTKDLKVMSEEIEVDIEQLKRITQGEFYIKNGSNSAIKVTTSDKYIDNNNAISDELWKQHLKYQKKHYYKKVINATGTDSSPDIILDKSDTSSSLPIPKFDMGE